MLKTLLLLFLGLICGCFCCSCMPSESDSAGLCRSDWVSRVRILNKTVNEQEMKVTYTVSHLQQLLPKHDTKTLPTTIQTHTMSSVCGVPELQVNHKYLLTGSGDTSSSLRLLLCRWIVPERLLIQGKTIVDAAKWEEFVRSANCIRRKSLDQLL
ncbi:unnamed protein product [Caenorhabditis auriculariae]|uniref:NTR domain-containing protein n=1 Tax=Caenorhabditis auriculariae TaxID=2777116 RepID=A0A8S1GVZ7_9PELO|nr:unnamed protein product [Caenorhabditis auriculariae]